MVVVYKCALTDNEISSDAYKIEETEFFKIINGKLIEEVEQDFDIGANASEDGAEEGEGVEKFKKTYPDCCGPEGQNHVDTYLGKKELKEKVMAYVKALTTSEKLSEETRTAFKAACKRKLTDEELKEQLEKGDKNSKMAIQKAIFDYFTSQVKEDTFQSLVAAEDFGMEGMIMGYHAEGCQPGDKVRLIVWKHGLTEEKF
jgi:ribosomal protein S16